MTGYQIFTLVNKSVYFRQNLFQKSTHIFISTQIQRLEIESKERDEKILGDLKERDERINKVLDEIKHLLVEKQLSK